MPETKATTKEEAKQPSQLELARKKFVEQGQSGNQNTDEFLEAIYKAVAAGK